MKTIKTLYSELDGRRTNKLDRARECSRLTIPSILPEEDFSHDDELPVLWSSLPGRGVTNLASRMVSAFLPVGDNPIFSFEPRDGAPVPVAAREQLDAIPRQVLRKLRTTNFRSVLYVACQHLLVTGDTKIMLDDDYRFRVFRLDQWVVRRTPSGQPIEVITRQWVDPEAMREEYRTIAKDGGRDRKDGFEELYTQYKWDWKSSVWEVNTEFRGQIIDTGKYRVSPFAVPRWLAIPGEDYGRSYCEELVGDLRTLEGLSETLVEGFAASTQFRMGVDPRGMTDIDELETAKNGQYVTSRREDVFTITADLRLQVQSNLEAVEQMRRELGRAFLMTSAIQRSGERVTATEWRALAGELEEVLGGIFSSLSAEILEPLVRRMLVLMEADGEIPQGFTELLDNVLDVKILTGLDAISNQVQLQQLDMWAERMAAAPPQAQSRIKWDNWVRLYTSKIGFDPGQLTMTDEEFQAVQEAEMQQAMQAQAAQQGIQSAGRIAEQQAMQGPPQ